MELREFISQTISEIRHGVQLAIDRGKDVKGVVNPVWGTSDDVSEAHLQKVTFDIAITVSEKSSDEANAGIKVVGIGFGGSTSNLSENSHISRIQFSIPIIPPVQLVGKSQGK